MKYVELGRGGAKISQLSFGGMRLKKDSALKVVRYAYERGINYYDSAFGYCGGKSEEWIGEALKDVRDRVYYATKNPIAWEKQKTRKRWRELLEIQLKRLKTDYIDYYHGIHSMNWDSYRKLWLGKELWKEARNQMEKGKIRHLYFSWHGDPKQLAKIIKRDKFEGVTMQYNILDRQNARSLALAKKQGWGTVVMGPVGGGRLGEAVNLKNFFSGVKTKTSPEAAFRFVFSNPNVQIAISGMESVRHVRENMATMDGIKPLTKRELQSIDRAIKKMAELAKTYCTGCGYCKPACEQKVDIPSNLDLYIKYKLYGYKQHVRNSYQWWARKSWRAEECTQCGSCEPLCPQKIPIRKRLKQLVRLATS